jgi:hypothetical protein
MLTVRFFNVGHGECTLIEHPSGQLTMVDINTSHDYDWNTRQDIVADASSGFPGGELLETIALDEAQRELSDPVAYLEQNYPRRTAAIIMKKLVLSIELQKLPSQPATKLPMKLVPSHRPIYRGDCALSLWRRSMSQRPARHEGSKLHRDLSRRGTVMR